VVLVFESGPLQRAGQFFPIANIIFNYDDFFYTTNGRILHLDMESSSSTRSSAVNCDVMTLRPVMYVMQWISLHPVICLVAGSALLSVSGEMHVSSVCHLTGPNIAEFERVELIGHFVLLSFGPS